MLNIYLIPNFRIVSLLLFEVCAVRLSMNRQIFASPFSSLNLVRYSLNLMTFTDYGKSMNSSYPFSLDTPESSAIVGSFVRDLSMLMLSFGRQYSTFGTAARVNIVSSMYMMRNPSLFALSIYRLSFCFSLIISSCDLLFCFFFHTIFLFLILCIR